MQVVKILLPIQGRTDMDAIANTAFSLAERFNAQVEGLYAYTAPRDQIRPYYEAPPPALYESLLKDLEQRSETARKRAKETFGQLAKPYRGITSRFLAMDGGTAHGVARQGRVADLIVIGAACKQDTGTWLDIRDAAIFQTGRPVMIVPEGPVPTEPGKTVVIGWKGTVEAARAVMAAKPFLSNAKAIHLVSAGRDAVSRAELKDVQTYLSLHSDTVKAAIVGADRPDTAELLLEEAGKHSDVLLVMGGYSHWRWRERVFGGVTEYMLQNANVPVLMAH